MLIAALVYVCYRYADRIQEALGDSGSDALGRLFAFILIYRHPDPVDRIRRAVGLASTTIVVNQGNVMAQQRAKMTERRGITIHFIDGSKFSLDFPKQTLNEIGTVLKMKEILAARHLVAQVDGALLVIPFENVKYIQAHPAPAELPEYVIKSATVSS